MMKKLVIVLALAVTGSCGDLDAQLAPTHAGPNACGSPAPWDEPAMDADPFHGLSGGPFSYPQPTPLACVRLRR